MERELVLLAGRASLRMLVTKQNAFIRRIQHRVELNVRKDRTVSARDVLIVRHHARLAVA